MAYHPHTLCLAPMMDCTNRHFRYFLRLISPHTRMYTEMVTTGALIHGDRSRFLDFDPAEHPIALQVGGSEPEAMAAAAEFAEQWGYDEININVGCPSDRVQKGRIGACLMADPNCVASCVRAMRAASSLPVTVKTRIGIDDQDSFEFLLAFVDTVAEAGCDTFMVHARKAWLQGLSPKQNRNVPPLCYDVVHALKQQRAALNIILNGGLNDTEACLQQLPHVDGLMIGRQAYHHPYFFAALEASLFQHSAPSRLQVMQQYLDYIKQQLAEGARLSSLTRHIHGLFLGQPNARLWRRYLSDHIHKTGASYRVVEDALALVC